MPKSAKALFYMVIGIVAALCVAAAKPDIAAAVAASPDSPAKAAELKKLKMQFRKSTGAIRFWQDRERGRWILHLRRDKCWHVYGKQRRQLCRLGRQMLRFHVERVDRLDARIAWLSLDVGNVGHWLCIHSGERGADGWRTNTGNGYYGGLQMDLAFQKAHGLDFLTREGTANNWTPREQMAVAQRAKRGVRTDLGKDGRVYTWQDRPRGYNPWPNTARDCGLL